MTLRDAVVLVFEKPPDGRLHSQHFEVIARDILALHILDGIAMARIEAHLIG